MRNLNLLDAYRVSSPELVAAWGHAGDHTCGLFLIPTSGPQAALPAHLKIIASAGEGWDHVSVSTTTRCPTWEEMAHVKALFFQDDELALQFHPPKSAVVNYHPYCLHLWRPWHQTVELPPQWMIAPQKEPRGTGPEAARKAAGRKAGRHA